MNAIFATREYNAGGCMYTFFIKYYILLTVYRYLFEADHTRFLPTVALENGPIELGLLWPEAVEPNISKTLTFPVVSKENSLCW